MRLLPTDEPMQADGRARSRSRPARRGSGAFHRPSRGVFANSRTCARPDRRKCSAPGRDGPISTSSCDAWAARAPTHARPTSREAAQLRTDRDVSAPSVVAEDAHVASGPCRTPCRPAPRDTQAGPVAGGDSHMTTPQACPAARLSFCCLRASGHAPGQNVGGPSSTTDTDGHSAPCPRAVFRLARLATPFGALRTAYCWVPPQAVCTEHPRQDIRSRHSPREGGDGPRLGSDLAGCRTNYP